MTEPSNLGDRAREIAAEIESAEYRRIRVSELVPWERNPRTRLDEGSDRLARTIGAVGWGADVLVQKGTNRVIGGHLRIRAAAKLGLEAVPCKVLDVDDARADEIALADNRGAEFAAWDQKALAGLLEELDVNRRAAIGWNEAEVDRLLAELAPPKPPPEPGPPLHDESTATIKVVHGSNLEVLPTLPENSFDAIVSDPPYGLAFMGKDWDKALPDPATWSALLRVAKPGAHLVAFGAPRLYHRLGVAIEDAGWELRDCLMWLFGTGFPKSLDVEKATLDPAWAGWGTALKPAWEPIVLARKPLAGTVASNVLEHGTGGVNVDATRIGTSDRWKGAGQHSEDGATWGGDLNRFISETHPNGRWPANVALDEEAAAALDVLDEKPSRFFYTAKASRAEREAGLSGARSHVDPKRKDGSAGRNSPRAGAGRQSMRANVHPTVKPVDLMRWLVRLVTPPGGHVLDPFGGSGSTGVACQAEGFDATLIELSPEYVKIARGRLGQTATGRPRKKRKP